MIFNIRCGCVRPLLPLEDFFFFFADVYQNSFCRFGVVDFWHEDEQPRVISYQCGCVPCRGCLWGMRRGSLSSTLRLRSSSSSSSRRLFGSGLCPDDLSWKGSSWVLTFSDKPSVSLYTLQKKKAWFQLCLSKWTSVPYFLVVGNGTLCLENRYNRKY